MGPLLLPLLLLLMTTRAVCGMGGMGSEDLRAAQQNIDTAVENAKEAVKHDEMVDQEKKDSGIDKTKDSQTANGMMGLFADSNEKTKRLAKLASIQIKALKELISVEKLNPFRLRVSRRYLRVWKKRFQHTCPISYDGPPCDEKAYYRSYDGTCNNVANPTWGASLTPQLREIPPMYDDGVDEPRRKDRLGNPLPSARLISNVVHSVDGLSPRDKDFTSMVMQWGQFIDHEFVSTPVLKGAMDANIECCGDENVNRSQCFPIDIPEGDPHFKTRCMNLVRSSPVPNVDCNPGIREQINQVTSFIDGSALYGSTYKAAMDLRTMKSGLMRTLDDFPAGKMLPKNAPDKCVIEHDGDYCMKAGDIRVNVVPSLGWSHTTLLREHNRIAKALSAINPHWDDDAIYQQTRRIIAAIEQVITYKEYLPSILNEETMKKYRLNLHSTRYANTYHPKLNPSVTNEFAVAAFRFGHSQIADYQATMDENFNFLEKKPIWKTYHKPHMVIYEHGHALDGIARWLSTDPQPLADSLFEHGTRDMLFLDKKNNSLDLPAINIQRSREHGTPAYNHWRVHCGLAKADMTDDGLFTLPDHTAEQTQKLQKAYRHVDDIDLFPGAMTETLLPQSAVGPTFACLLGRQFRRLMRGDRYWHELHFEYNRFTKDQLHEVRKVSLAKVLCDNYNITKLQPNVFRVPTGDNQRIDCSNIPGIDLSKWKACEFPLADGRPSFAKHCPKEPLFG